MGKLTIHEPMTVTLYTRIYVDADGRFLGEYAPSQTTLISRKTPPDGIELPEDAPPPPTYRHIWQDGAWLDPGPSEAELAREAAEKEAAEKREAAMNKLADLGLTADDIKALL